MEKTGKFNPYDFYKLLKSSWTTFKTIFKTLSALGGLSRDHYWRDGIKEMHEFQGFLGISRRVFEIFSQNIFC